MPAQGADGTFAAGLRQESGRLVLQRLRRAGEASRAELARASGLTSTAIGDIIKHLGRMGLVRSVGKRRAGQRGQPATMFTLDAGGAYAIGVRLDRSGVHTILADLAGAVLGERRHPSLLPPPAEALRIVHNEIESLTRVLPLNRRRRIVGVGVARPYNLGSWLAELDLPRESFGPWETFPFGAELAQSCGLPVFEDNDGNAAATAELFHGCGRSRDDFLYVFIGPAIGGGIVLGGQCLRGPTNNAGDVGLIPVPLSTLASAAPHVGPPVLLGRASLNALARHLRHRGLPVGPWEQLAFGGAVEQAALEWMDDCIAAMAQPLLAAAALLDIAEVVIDSDLPAKWIDRLIVRAVPVLAAATPEARTPPTLVRGSFGAMAGALGAATVPLFLRFGPRPGKRSPTARDLIGGVDALVA